MPDQVTAVALKERLHRAHLAEYWQAGYRKPFPDTGALPHLWKWDEMKDLLEQTSQLIGIEEAERRGLILTNPGLSPPYLTPTLYADIQLLMPGEKAPAHRHTSSASRLFMEGTGGYTVVEGEKCHMEPGDLVINPSWAWHDHGNEGEEEILFLSVLDVPLVETLGCIFYDHDYREQRNIPKAVQSLTKPPNVSERLFRHGGLRPVLGDAARSGHHTPQLLYKLEHARACLNELNAFEPDPYDAFILEYVNPATGGPVHPTMSFKMQLLPAGYQTAAHRHTASTVYLAVEGDGRVELDDGTLNWATNDVFVLPSWVWHRLQNTSPEREAMLLSVTDEPTTRRLGLYREEGGDE